MAIEWFDVDGIPVPLINSVIQLELHDFMHHMATSTSARHTRREPTTIRNIKYHMKMWFDYCSDHDYDWRNVTYEGHLEPFRDFLVKDRVENCTFNLYYSSWRMFYEWCSNNNIPTLMTFPGKVTVISPVTNKHNDMLAHTKDTVDTYEKDPGHLPTIIKTDVASEIVSQEKFYILAAALGDIDPVFEGIAYMMYETGLRLGGVLQVPIGPSKLNPDWMSWAELDHEGLDFQFLYYIYKGKKRIEKCIVNTSVMKIVHDKYVLPKYDKDDDVEHDDKKRNYEERAQLYASKRNRGAGKRPSTDNMWLNKHGKIIHGFDVHRAFAIAREKIGFYVVPHFLRHSYATYTVLNYLRVYGIDLDAADATLENIHYAVKEQLGHSDIGTTELYIKTIKRVKSNFIMPHLSPLQKSEINIDEINEKILKEFGFETES